MATPRYAWVVAMCCFCTGIVTMGGMVGFGYTMTGMADEFSVTLGDLAILNSLYTLCSNGLAFVAGMVADKIGPRFTMGFGMLINGVMILCAGLIAPSLGAVIGFVAVAGLGASALIGSVMPKLISNWFAPHHRGKANMFYTVGPSATGAVYGIVLPAVLLAAGWRADFGVIGGVNTVCAIIFLLLCRNKPGDLGTYAFGYTEVEAAMLVEAEDTAKADVNTKAMLIKVLKYPLTWGFGLAYACWMAYFTTYTAYGTSTLMAVGIDATFVGVMNSVVMIATIISQFTFAALSDRFLSRKTILTIVCLIFAAIETCFYFFLCNVRDTGNVDVGGIWTLMILSGIFKGQGALINTINVEVFPPSMRAVGPAVVATITLLGASGGPLIAGAIINAHGGDPVYYLWVLVPAIVIGTIFIQIFAPTTGGKHGDPQAIKEAREALGDDAVRAAVSSTTID